MQPTLLVLSFLFALNSSRAEAADAAPKLKSLKITKTSEDGGRKRSVDASIEVTDDVGLASVKLVAVASSGAVLSAADGPVKGKSMKKAKFNLTVDVSDPATSGVRVLIEDTAGQTTILASPKDFALDLDSDRTDGK